MNRATLTVAVVLCSLLVAPAVSACVSIVPANRLPGETDAQLADRGRRIQQNAHRAAADSVFLARVSSARMVGRLEADYTLTPFFPLYDTAPPADPVTLRASPLIVSCSPVPELGHVYVVYADRNGSNWTVTHIIGHDDLQDRPPGMPTARDTARGVYDLPSDVD